MIAQIPMCRCMHGQLKRHAIPPQDPPKPTKYDPKDYFLNDQRDYEKAPGIKDPKKFVYPKPIVMDVKPYKCMDYTEADYGNAWMTVYGENLGKKSLKDIAGIYIVAGEHEFQCTNVMVGPAPPPQPKPVSSKDQGTNNSSINSTKMAAEDQNMLDELDEIGVTDNSNNLKQSKIKS